MAVRREGWLPQIEKANTRARSNLYFSEIVTVLSSRNIDVEKTVVLESEFVPGGDRGEFLLILPNGQWVFLGLYGDGEVDWNEGCNDEYSDDFQSEMEKFRTAWITRRMRKFN